MEDVPQPLKIAAIVQIVSGAINLMMGWWLGSCVISSFCGILTLGFGGQLCGFLSCLLLPIGIIEIGIGIYGLMSAREAATLQKLVSFVEIASIFGGGIGSLVAGIAVNVLRSSDEVVAFLEG